MAFHFYAGCSQLVIFVNVARGCLPTYIKLKFIHKCKPFIWILAWLLSSLQALQEGTEGDWGWREHGPSLEREANLRATHVRFWARFPELLSFSLMQEGHQPDLTSLMIFPTARILSRGMWTFWQFLSTLLVTCQWQRCNNNLVTSLEAECEIQSQL
jgi:hypothetical protein